MGKPCSEAERSLAFGAQLLVYLFPSLVSHRSKTRVGEGHARPQTQGQCRGIGDFIYSNAALPSTVAAGPVILLSSSKADLRAIFSSPHPQPCKQGWSTALDWNPNHICLAQSANKVPFPGKGKSSRVESSSTKTCFMGRKKQRILFFFHFPSSNV